METKNIKLCKNCKHAKRNMADFIFFLRSYEYAKCKKHPKEEPEIDLITGKKKKVLYFYCSTERIDGLKDSCGLKLNILRRRNNES